MAGPIRKIYISFVFKETLFQETVVYNGPTNKPYLFDPTLWKRADGLLFYHFIAEKGEIFIYTKESL